MAAAARRLELAAGAVDDDARQDEDHADDAEQVRRVLREEAVMARAHAAAADRWTTTSISPATSDDGKPDAAGQPAEPEARRRPGVRGFYR